MSYTVCKLRKRIYINNHFAIFHPRVPTISNVICDVSQIIHRIQNDSISIAEEQHIALNNTLWPLC